MTIDDYKKALAAAQASNVALREALREFYPCGRISHDRLTCERSLGHAGFHSSTDGAQVNWPESEAVGWSPLPPVLAQPADDEALREFGQRCIRVWDRGAQDHHVANTVAAVLKGAS